MANKLDFNHNRDDFYRKTIGYDDWYNSSRDITKFTGELDNIYYSLYALNGDNRRDQTLTIYHPNYLLQKKMNDYFFGFRSSEIYGHISHHLGDMFAHSIKNAAMFGDTYLYIEWKPMMIGQKSYVMPYGFHYIQPETIKKQVKNGRKVYKQRYSLFTKIKNRKRLSEYRTRYLGEEEVLHLCYPLSDVPPVHKYKRYLRKFDRFLKFTLESSEGGAYITPRKLRVEIARSKKYTDEQRKNNLNRAVVRSGFFQPIENMPLTRYYDYYTVAQYISAKYRLRQYAIDEFNKQVLKLVQQKNNMKKPPELRMTNLLTEDDIQGVFEKWAKGNMTNDDFIDYLKSNKY